MLASAFKRKLVPKEMLMYNLLLPMKWKMVKCSAVLIIVCLCGAPVKAQSMFDDVSYENLGKLIDAARENYPRVKAMTKQVEIAQVDIRKAKLGWFQPLSVSYYYMPPWGMSDNAPILFNGVQFGITLNVGALIQTPSDIKKAKLQRDVTELNKDEYLLTLSADVKTRYFDFIAAKSVLNARLRASLDANTLQKDVRFRYQKGEVSFDELTLSNTQVVQQNISRITAEQAYLNAVAGLEEIIGVPLDTVIQIQLYNGNN